MKIELFEEYAKHHPVKPIVGEILCQGMFCGSCKLHSCGLAFKVEKRTYTVENIKYIKEHYPEYML